MGKITEETRRETGLGTDLWRVIAPLILWAVHFLSSYAWVAVQCEKVGDASLPVSRWVVGGLTVTALAGVLMLTRHLWAVRARSLTDNDFDFEHNTPEERHRFLSHVSLMLCALSAVAILFAALPMVLVQSCQ